MEEQQHRIRVQKHLTTARWTAFCSCGWEGSPQSSLQAAELDGDEHVVAIT